MKHYQVCLNFVWIDKSSGREVRWRSMFDDIEAKDGENACAIAGEALRKNWSIECLQYVVLPYKNKEMPVQQEDKP